MSQCGNTRMDRTPIKSQHTKLTLEKKNPPPLLPEFQLAIFGSRVRRSKKQNKTNKTHAIPQCTGVISPPTTSHKLQTAVSRTLSSTSAIVGYAKGLPLPLLVTLKVSTKMSASEQFRVGAQVAVSLWQTIQIVSGLSAIVSHGNYASTDNIKSLES